MASYTASSRNQIARIPRKEKKIQHYFHYAGKNALFKVCVFLVQEISLNFVSILNYIVNMR